LLSFGGGSLLLVAACWTAAAIWRDTRRLALLLLLQTAFLYAHFAKVQDLGIHHWYLVQPAVLLIVGIAAARVVCWLRSRALRSLLLAAYVAAGGLVGATVLVPAFAPLRDRELAILPWHTHYPLVRDDLAEYRRLITVLDAELRAAGPDAQLYVLASSMTLSDSHIRNTELSLGLTSGLPPRLLRTAHVDKRDGFPDDILDAELICATIPPALHLGVANQQVVVQPLISLATRVDIGMAFEPLSDVFQLENGTRTIVFRKIREITASEVAALSARLRVAYPDRPFVYEPPAER
jgi:hypothetical protein